MDVRPHNRTRGSDCDERTEGTYSYFNIAYRDGLIAAADNTLETAIIRCWLRPVVLTEVSFVVLLSLYWQVPGII